MLYIFVENCITYFQDFQESSKEQHKFKYFCIINIFTVTFDQFNVSLLKVLIYIKKLKKTLTSNFWIVI